MALKQTPRLVAVAILAAAAACTPATMSSPSPSAGEGAAPSSPGDPVVEPQTGSLVIVGRILTMDEPAIAEALFIDDGLVAAIGSRDAVLAQAGDVPVFDIGQNVAYPGFVDAHAHWIGDREYYHLGSPAEAIDTALARGWTSISEQWVNPERLDELTGLALDLALPIRVDAYLALNYGQDFFGDWYAERQPGDIGDHLRVRGLKIHLDDGWGETINWELDDLTAAIGRADDAGWQVSVHAMSTEAIGVLLDAYEGTIGLSGPNPLHHRIEHALQVTDEQLSRLVAMDIATVIHLEGASDWMLDARNLPAVDRDDLGEQLPFLGRWRDFVDAGLHVASATDAPWTFEDFVLTDDMGRPLDQIAAGMDGHVRTSADLPPWAAGQLLTAEQGLRAVTLDAAYALGDEARRGHLAPGTLGDVTILSGDVTDATPDEIRAMSIVATIVGGIPAFCADPDACPPGT